MSADDRVPPDLAQIVGEYFETSPKKPKKGRGRAKASIALIEAMYSIAEAMQPITGRGIGYKLFTQQLIPSMSRRDMQKVYRLLKEAREEGTIPWEWIVDETRGVEKVATWDDPEDFSQQMTRDYRRDNWNHQPVRCEVWSEKGTVRGVLKPVLDKYGVGFNAVHGFNSATDVYRACQDGDERPMHLLYVGDYDPSGMCMSVVDLPKRITEYGGEHIVLNRLLLLLDTAEGLPSFPASDKAKDTRHKWFVRNYGERCWELDAMDPRVLRERVEAAIKSLIEPAAWERCEKVNRAEQESLKGVLEAWKEPRPQRDDDRAPW